MTTHATTAELMKLDTDVPESDYNDGVRLLSHAYDGIREYDNPLPGWWSAVFIATFVFSFLYFAYYNIAGCGKSPEDNYRVALAGWPLLLGAVTVALLWLGLAGLILPHTGWPVPVLWPTVTLLALLAWVQALMWFPFPLAFLRIVAAALVWGIDPALTVRPDPPARFSIQARPPAPSVIARTIDRPNPVPLVASFGGR